MAVIEGEAPARSGRWHRFWPICWRWLLWGVLVGGVFPILLLLLIEAWELGHWPSGMELVGNGDLFLVASMLLLGSLQGLFVMPDRRGVDEAVLVTAIITPVLGIVTWTLITASVQDHKKFGLTWLPTWGGLGFFMVGLLVVGMSMWVQARSEGRST